MPLFYTKRFTTRERDAVSKAIHHIEIHYAEKISPEQLALDYTIPIKKLQKGVKLVTGRTIHSYILAVRLNQAKELLSTTDDPVQNIPEKIGLVNLSHFSKVFKKHVGQSPTAYRISIKE
jgi:AraC-like DNA-binding protein